MDLVYIYGPPAAGKLTVATELARLTSYRLFHNHLSINCVKPVFEYGTETFWKLVHGIRLQVIEEAARAGTSLLYTSVFAPENLPLVEARFEAVERHGGRICLVRLTCSREALEARVGTPSRVALDKLTGVDLLRKMLSDHDVFALIPGRDSLTVENDGLSPLDVARRIAFLRPAYSGLEG
jgi:hypothetical protein